MLSEKTKAFGQLCICQRENEVMIKNIIKYKNHNNGSRAVRAGSTDNRRLLSGEIFRTEISGNKAKNTVMTSPRKMPCEIASRETDVVG